MPLPFIPLSDEELFPVTNDVLPAWILLAVAPTWWVTEWLVNGLCVFNSLIYVGLAVNMITNNQGASEQTFQDFTSLDGIVKLFSNRTAAFGGWMHYIVFDLLVGRWVAQDAAGRGVPRLVMLPFIFFTLMLGPSGFVAYVLLVRPFFAPKGGSTASINKKGA